MAKWWQPVVLTFLLAGAAGFVAYGFTNRPLVDYTLEAPRFWNFTPTGLGPESGLPMTLGVKVRDRGLTDSVVNVTMIAWNATVAAKETGPFLMSTSLVVSLSAKSDSWGTVTFYLRPAKDAPTFAVSCTVTKVTDYSSFSGVVSTFFIEIKAQWPVTAWYVKTSFYEYEQKK